MYLHKKLASVFDLARRRHWQEFYAIILTLVVMKAKTTRAKTTTKPVKKDIAATYNQYKLFQGQQYTGMKIGRGHKW